MQSLAQAGRVLSAFWTVPSGGFALRSNTGMGRERGNVVADGAATPGPQ